MNLRPLLLALLALGSPTSALAQWVEPAHVLHTLEGTLEEGQLGYVVSALGDCDGDGVDDFAIGAPLYRAGGSNSGRVRVHSGATGALLFERDGQKGDQLGRSIAGVGDVDGDGRADVVVGAPQAFFGPGRVLVLSGDGGEVLATLSGRANGDYFGASLALVGDVDEDGCDDFVVGAPGHDVADASAAGDSIVNAGRVTLHSGADSRKLASWTGSRTGGHFGSALDGSLDHRLAERERLLVVGESGDRRELHARVHVFRGLAEEPSFLVEGGETAPRLGGTYVSVLGDVDADGVPDVYASDWRSSVHGELTGLVVVHSGRTGERLLRLTGEKSHEGFGTGDGRVGDFDGDGHADLLVGSWLAGEAAAKGGRVQLFSGADGRELRRWTGTEAGASLGFDTAGLGDVNGDGLLDFLFSAARADASGAEPREDVGAVYLVSGEICDPGDHSVPEPVDLPTMEEADALFKQRRFDEAADAFRRIASARPEQSRAWFLLGLSLHFEERYEEALTAHLRAAQFPEHAAAATYNAACAHALLGNAEESFVLLDRAIAAGFDDLRLMEEDGDLVSLRDDPRWTELLAGKRGGAFVEPDATILYELRGDDTGSQFGWALATPGDCDGDGVNDLLVSAPGYERDDERVGRVQLFSGRTAEPLFRWEGMPRTSFGRSLAAVGDADADGVPDLAVGAPGVRGTTGRVHVYSGADGSLLFNRESDAVGDQFGRALAGIGDLDGDGHDDLAVGACGDGSSLEDDGCVVILSGADGSVLRRLGSRGKDERFGSAVAGRFAAGDGMLAVGAQDGGPQRRGRVYVFHGDLDEPALVIEADEHAQDFGRHSVTLFPDVDGDGVSELACSDWRYEEHGDHTGQVRLISGSDGTDLWTVTGPRSREGFGIGALPAGDLDGDGSVEIVVGAWLNREGAYGGGKAYALCGRSGKTLATWTSTVPNARAGSAVVGLGDVDGDGVPDLALGAPSRSRRQERSGRVIIVSGASAGAGDEPQLAPTGDGR